MTSSSSLDIVACTVDGRELVVLERSAGRRSHELPWEILDPLAPLERSAIRIARSVLGETPAWVGQLGAYGDRAVHPSKLPLSVAFVVIAPAGTRAPKGMSWVPLDGGSKLPTRQRLMAADATAMLRFRMHTAPIAFRLLPASFTLSDLQRTYELLLERPLHKASFRRTLQASGLVEAADEWKSEGRGRPAQMFRYAPRPEASGRRTLTFDLLE
ncbi:MAG: NrtR DNA-binding winged helix domain-containing protein [Gemmatimonadaceae bacterium]